MPTMSSKPKQRRTFPLLQIKTFDADGAGTFTGYLAVFNNVDQGGDKILPGAFSKTLAELREKQKRNGSRYLLPIFFGHNPSDPIGGFTDAKEDDHGLLVTGELDLDIEQGRRAYSGMKRGYLSGLSIGYYTIKDGYEGSVRLLREVALIEGSVTPIPMNQDALVVGVKNRLSASGFQFTEKGAAYMRRFARTTRRRAPQVPAKALDFATTLASRQQEDSLQEEWSDMLQSLVDSLSAVMWQAQWVNSGYAADDQTDHPALANTIVDQFSTQMRDLLDRSFAANFVPSLDDDGDSFMDPDEQEMSANLGSEDYMSAPRPKEKAGRILSAAKRDRMLKSLNMIADGHKDLMSLHAETEPTSNDDKSTADGQPGGSDGKTVTQPSVEGTQEQTEGQEPGAVGDTTPSETSEEAARKQQIRDQIAALSSQLEKEVA
jgi:HK97 family phage prohead protease